MMYAYSDIKRSHRPNVLLFQAIFCSFAHVLTLRIKIWQKCKKYLEILSFYTDVPLIKIICTPDMIYGSWHMKFNRQNYSELFWKYQKWKENPVYIIILHKSTKNHDYLLYCLRDVARDWCKCLFFHFAIFSPFYPPTAQKLKMSKN